MEIAPKPETAPIGPVETTSDERTMAVLANALQMVGAWIGPLIILLVKRESRFVSFAGSARYCYGGFYGSVVCDDFFWNHSGARTSFISTTDHLCGFSSFLARVDVHLGIYSGDCHSLQHQSRTWRMGGVSHLWQNRAAYFKARAGRGAARGLIVLSFTLTG